LGEEEKNL